VTSWTKATCLAFTVKVAVAVSADTVPRSLPDTVTGWAPVATLGTVKVHENVPVADVVWEVQVWVAIEPPAIAIDPIVVLTENPVPLTATEVPTGPVVGTRVMMGVVIVNVVEAVSPVTVPTSLPETVTVYPPLAIDGTTNEHVKVPVAEVVRPMHVCVAGVAPLNVIAPIVVVTENPEPVTVTETPFGPWIGDRVIAGVLTVKPADETTEDPEYVITK
jgi:hypothetical protein